MIDRRILLRGLGAAMVGSGLGAGAEAAGRRVFTASVALERNRVLLAVGLNGSGPYNFLLDTGAFASLIRDDLAGRLKLPIVSHTRMAGMGGRDIYPVLAVRDLLIGGSLRQRDVAFVGAGDLNYGRDLGGALAAGLLTAGDADLDFDRGELRLYPDGRETLDGYTRLASTVTHKGSAAGSAFLFATATVNGQALRFLLDTGAPRAVSLFPAGWRKLGWWDGARPFAPFRATGIGGQGGIGRLVRADAVTFGDLTIAKPLVALYPPNYGAAQGLADGLIGLPLIRRFNLAVDGRSRSLWARRSGQPAEAEDAGGRAGLWLDQHGDAIVATAVGTGSPAARAGVMAGDRVIGLDWAAALRALAGPVGTRTRLTLERGGQRREVTMTLIDYL